MKAELDSMLNALLDGDHRITIFTGGACLEIYSTAECHAAWTRVEDQLTNAVDCYVMLRLTYELARLRGLKATFYPDGSTCVGRLMTARR